MQFKRTIIVTVVAALTLMITPKAKAISLEELFCGGLGAAGGAVAGYQFGSGKGQTVSSVVGGLLGWAAGVGICNAIRTNQQQAVYNTMSSCINDNVSCNSSNSNTEVRTAKAGYWVKDVSQQCRCFDMNGNEVGSQQVGSAGSAYCVTYKKEGYRWVAQHLVDEKEVIVDDLGSNRYFTADDLRRMDENFYRNHQYLQAANQGRSANCIGSNGKWIPGCLQKCTVFSPDFFKSRHAFVDHRCQEYLDNAPPVRFSDGTKGSYAMADCQDAMKRPNGYRAYDCQAKVIDYKLIY